METGAEGDGAPVGVDLDITKRLVEVGGDDDVDGLDGTREGLVQILLGDLELEKSTVDLVDDNDGLDALTKGLAEHSLGLHADTLDGVDDDESTVGDTEGSSDLGGEINVTGRVDQVDKEVGVGDLLDAGNVLQVLLGEGGVQRDGGRLDGDATLLLVGSRIRVAGIASLGGGDDTGFGEERVGEGGLAVVDVGNDRHVTDIGRVVHEPTDLVDREAIIGQALARVLKTRRSGISTLLKRSRKGPPPIRLHAMLAASWGDPPLSSPVGGDEWDQSRKRRPTSRKPAGKRRANSLDHFGGIVGTPILKVGSWWNLVGEGGKKRKNPSGRAGVKSKKESGVKTTTPRFFL